VIGIRESMPRPLGDEDGCALFKRVRNIIQGKGSAAFQNVEGFVHVEMAVDRNPRTGHHLLGSQGEIAGACGGANLNQDLALIAKMNELFSFIGAE